MLSPYPGTYRRLPPDEILVSQNGGRKVVRCPGSLFVSYEVRPEIEFKGDRLGVGYPRFSSYRADRQPEWVTIEPVEGEAPGTKVPAKRAIARMGNSDTIDVTPGRVVVNRDGETLTIDIVPDQSVTARGALPIWAEQKSPGAEIAVSFGFAGRVEIDSNDVKIRRRFLGWENFVFDANSPFWGKSFSEVVALIVSVTRLKPKMSNAALAWDNIWNNAEWQHGDVWTKLLQTIVMAFVGTVFASLLAFPLAFVAARNITPNRFANQALKRFFDFLRSVDMLIWALFFTRAFGPGPLAGISAIFFTDTGTFGKLYSEALENIDDKQREGIRSVGAAPALVQRYGVVPQVMPLFLSQSLYFWESNTRSATIIGAVGAGGIGLKLWEAMRTNSDWENVAYMVLLILVVVFIFDNISSALRRRLIGRAAVD
jgi:phosphonate transport system permease protein